MPEIKRSKRIKNKKSKDPSEKTTVTLNNQHTPSPRRSNKNSQTCIACHQTHAPIRRYKVNEWIQCDQCDSWWHAECACMPVEDILHLTLYDIEYTCALCILKGSPWILENHKLTNIAVKTEPEVTTIPQDTCISQKCPESVSEKEECIVIVDNIQSPKKFRSSIDIRKETKKFSDTQPKFSYSLPKGGVALEFENKEQAETVIGSWSGEAFGTRSQCHKPRGKKETLVGFLKNLPNFVKTIEIEKTYSQLYTVRSVRRLLYRSSQKPMPVVRIEFDSAEELELAKTLQINYSINGKPAFLESERSLKIVRCFNCHRIGHIARACVYETRCGNCAKTDHTDSECTYQRNCPNCDGDHHASSKNCPVYQSLLQLHRNKVLF